MIKQVTGWVLVLQHYFISLCRNIAFHVKQLGSLTLSSGKDDGTCKKDDDHKRRHSNDDSDKSQTLSKNSKLRPSSEIPGPKCFPVVGSLFQFSKFGTRRIHELALDRHEKYGDIFREKLFSTEIIFLGNTTLMKEWMTQEGKLPSSTKQEPSHVFSEECPQFRRGLFFRDGEDWLRMRKSAHACIVKKASEFETEGLFEACEDCIDEELEKLRVQASQPENKGWIDTFELRSYAIVVKAINSVVFGKSYKKFEEYTGATYDMISKNALEANIHNQDLLDFPARVAKWLRLPMWTQFSSKLTYNLEHCIRFVQLLRDDMKKSPESCSLKSHGLSYKLMQINCLEDDADDLLTDFGVDSKDPLAGTFLFTNQLLGMLPEVQQNIYNEVSRVYPDNEPITYAKAKDLEYTEAFFKEALRIFPIASFTSRVALEDTIVGGYLIPPGAIINYSVYVAQRDSRYFSDPLKVLPERWLSKAYLDKHLPSGSMPTQPTCDPTAFAPFGLKQRLCIGSPIATSILTLWIAKFVKNFKITSKELPRETMRTILYPENPGPIHIHPR